MSTARGRPWRSSREMLWCWFMALSEWQVESCPKWSSILKCKGRKGRRYINHVGCYHPAAIFSWWKLVFCIVVIPHVNMVCGLPHKIRRTDVVIIFTRTSVAIVCLLVITRTSSERPWILIPKARVPKDNSRVLLSRGRALRGRYCLARARDIFVALNDEWHLFGLDTRPGFIVGLNPAGSVLFRRTMQRFF